MARRMPASHPRSGAKRKRRWLGRQLGLTTAFNLGRAVLRKSSLSTDWARNSFRHIFALFCFDDLRNPSNTILLCFLHCWLTLRTLFGCCGVFHAYFAVICFFFSFPPFPPFPSFHRSRRLILAPARASRGFISFGLMALGDSIALGKRALFWALRPGSFAA